MGKMIKIIAEHNIGDTAYLVTDPEQMPRLVTGILLKPNDLIEYELAWCEGVSYHYGFEIIKEQDLLKKMQ
jgi:hypothetical protein